MKKVVVVVDAFSELPKQELFEGKDLKVHNPSSVGSLNPSSVGSLNIPILIVMDGDEELAVFKKWHYWKKIE